MGPHPLRRDARGGSARGAGGGRVAGPCRHPRRRLGCPPSGSTTNGLWARHIVTTRPAPAFAIIAIGHQVGWPSGWDDETFLASGAVDGRSVAASWLAPRVGWLRARPAWPVRRDPASRSTAWSGFWEDFRFLSRLGRWGAGRPRRTRCKRSVHGRGEIFSTCIQLFFVAPRESARFCGL